MKTGCIFILAALLTMAGRAQALIDPKFTPVHLYKAVNTAALLELVPRPEGAPPTAKVLAAIKGEKPGTVVLDVTKMSDTAQQNLADAVGAKGVTALLLLGDVGYSDGLKNVQSAGAILVGGAWFGIETTADRKLRPIEDARNLRNVWAGSATMLARCFQYIAADPAAAAVPVASGVKWGQTTLIGTVAGHVSGCHAVELFGDGRMCLLVASDKGDRLYRPDGGKCRDVTAASKLTSRSKYLAIADFTGDDRPDVLSWDGKQLTLHAQAADHTFGAGRQVKWTGECRGLCVIGLDGGKRAGVVVNTGSVPVVLAIAADGLATPTPLSAAPLDPALGAPGPCVVGDFDNDGFTDILQVCVKGTVLYRGGIDGKFAAPISTPLRLPAAPTSLSIGDFDADGLLDVIGATPRGVVALRNCGDGRFDNHLSEAGEISYDEYNTATGSAACDLNGDGRQELLLLFAEGRSPGFFFNRGFFAMGVDRALAEGFSGDAPLACADSLAVGQQAAVAADFDGDGAEDLAIVARGGEVFLLRTAQQSRPRLGLAVALPATLRGPLTLTAEDGKRNLGARLVRPGMPLLLGKEEPGPLQLRWRRPDGQPAEKKVIVEEFQRIELPAGQP